MSKGDEIGIELRGSHCLDELLEEVLRLRRLEKQRKEGEETGCPRYVDRRAVTGPHRVPSKYTAVTARQLPVFGTLSWAHAHFRYSQGTMFGRAQKDPCHLRGTYRMSLPISDSALVGCRRCP